MTGKERVEAIFAHKPTDKVPIYMGNISSRVASRVLGREAYVGGGAMRWREACALWEGSEAHQEYLERCRRDALDIAVALDLDYVRPAYWRMQAKPTQRIDQYTFLYGDPDGRWFVMRYEPETELYSRIGHSKAPEPTYESLERQVEKNEVLAAAFSPTADGFSNLENALAKLGATRAVHGTGVGIYIPWYDIGGQEIWLEATVLRPDLVGRLLDAQVVQAAKNIELQARLGVPYLHGGGDFAGKHGPVYSPRVFRELVLPRLQEVSRHCREYGCYHLFASDGNLWPVADDLFGLSGVAGYYEIDKDCGMDLRTLRKRFPHLTLLGGISSARLHRGTVEDVRDEVMSALEAARSEGSIMVGCSNLVMPGTPHTNFMTMMEVLHRHR